MLETTVDNLQTPVDPPADSLADSAADLLADCYLVRLGVLGQVGRLRSAEPVDYRRGARVVCRTRRGVELGQVLSPVRRVLEPKVPSQKESSPEGTQAKVASSAPFADEELLDGRILRAMTTEDEILWGHLREHADAAHEACQSWLTEQGIAGLLIDVEPLLDGKTLYFHFLDRVSEVVQHQIDHLASLYERAIRQSKFAQLLEHGCGPGCGTAEAKNGCGSKGGCAVCHVASHCKK